MPAVAPSPLSHPTEDSPPECKIACKVTQARFLTPSLHRMERGSGREATTILPASPVSPLPSDGRGARGVRARKVFAQYLN